MAVEEAFAEQQRETATSPNSPEAVRAPEVTLGTLQTSNLLQEAMLLRSYRLVSRVSSVPGTESIRLVVGSALHRLLMRLPNVEL